MPKQHMRPTCKSAVSLLFPARGYNCGAGAITKGSEKSVNMAVCCYTSKLLHNAVNHIVPHLFGVKQWKAVRMVCRESLQRVGTSYRGLAKAFYDSMKQQHCPQRGDETKCT